VPPGQDLDIRWPLSMQSGCFWKLAPDTMSPAGEMGGC
jgi:hypothetical protein